MAKYGMPYMGSKSKIADDILSVLPDGKRFVDLFGGGGAMTHAALLSGKYESVLYNDYDSLVVDLFQRAISGEFNYDKFTPEWIDREKFFKEKDNDGYIAICWSFGNKRTSYAFGKEIEHYKKAAHNYVIFDIWNDILTPFLQDNRLKSKDLHERRIEYIRIVRQRVKEIYKKDIMEYRQLQQLEQLERLQQLQQLEELVRLERLQLSNNSYTNFKYQSGDIVYCDIPYKDKEKYNNNNFNTEEFFNWCRKQPYDIYISEENAPEDFQEIWKKPQKRILSATTNNVHAVEKLFLHKGVDK
jgi:site-specific DNA-adenine methylase